MQIKHSTASMGLMQRIFRRTSTAFFTPVGMGFLAIGFFALFTYFPGADISVESNDVLDGFFPQQAAAPNVWESIFNGKAMANEAIGLTLDQAAMTELDFNRILFSVLPSYTEISWFYFLGLVILYLSGYFAIRLVTDGVPPKWMSHALPNAAVAIGASFLALLPHSAPVIGALIALNLFVAAAALSFGNARWPLIVFFAILSALFDDAPLGGIYYKPLFVVVAGGYALATCKTRPLVAALAILMLMLVFDYRLFVGALEGVSSQRSTWQDGASASLHMAKDDWVSAFNGAKTMIFGVPDHYHYQWNTKQSALLIWFGGIVVASIALLIAGPVRREALASRCIVWMGVSSILLLVVILDAFLYGSFRVPMIPLAVWLHQPIQFERAFALILPLLSATTIAFVLSPLLELVVDARAKAATVIVAAILFANWIHTPFVRKMANVEHHEKAGSDNPFIPNYTVGTYYLRGAYRALKRDLGPNWRKERVITIGGDPMIAAYNGLSNLDGYYPQYPKYWQKAFRAVAAPALDRNPEQKALYDGWGNRFGVPVVDNVNGKLDAPLDGCALGKIGGTLVLSYGPLLNPAHSRLVENGKVTAKTDGLETTLYRYRVDSTACTAHVK